MATPTADEALDVIAQAQEAGIRLAGSVAESWAAMLRGVPGLGSVLGADTSGSGFGNSFGDSFGGALGAGRRRAPPSRPSTASQTQRCSSSKHGLRRARARRHEPRCGRVGTPARAARDA